MIFRFHVILQWGMIPLMKDQSCRNMKGTYRRKQLHTRSIIPVSKRSVTPIYKPLKAFGRGTTLLRGLTNHCYYLPLTKWHYPCIIWFQSIQMKILYIMYTYIYKHICIYLLVLHWLKKSGHISQHIVAIYHHINWFSGCWRCEMV